jgi:hypothetical protein
MNQSPISGNMQLRPNFLFLTPSDMLQKKGRKEEGKMNQVLIIVVAVDVVAAVVAVTVAVVQSLCKARLVGVTDLIGLYWLFSISQSDLYFTF